MFHVVDDSEILREMLVEMIESHGSTAIPFASALEYLEYVRSDQFKPPSAVITDVHMPHMSGYEMMEQVLAINPSIQFAVLSGEPNIPSRYKDKACLFLEKPCAGHQIQKMIHIFKHCESNAPPSPGIDDTQFCDRGIFDLSSS